MGLRRLWRSDHRQHSGSLAVSVRGGLLFLFQDNVLVADGTNHRAIRFPALLQEPVEPHYPSATHWDPDLLGTLWAHAPLSQSKSAKYIPEPGHRRIFIFVPNPPKITPPFSP